MARRIKDLRCPVCSYRHEEAWAYPEDNFKVECAECGYMIPLPWEAPPTWEDQNKPAN